jgi:hypothetical protein
MKFQLSLLGFALVVGTLPGDSLAQISLPMTSPLGVDMMVDSENAKAEAEARRRREAAQAAARQNVRPPNPIPQNAYRQNPASVPHAQQSVQSSQYSQLLWQQNLASFVRTMDRSKPGVAPVLTQMSNTSQYTQTLRRNLSQVGLGYDNLPDAMAMYTVYGWMAVNDARFEPTPAQMTMISRYHAQKLAQDVGYLQMSSQDRQVLSDNFHLLAVLIAGRMDHAQSQPPAIKEQLRRECLMQARWFGIDLSAINITENGIVAR